MTAPDEPIGDGRIGRTGRPLLTTPDAHCRRCGATSFLAPFAIRSNGLAVGGRSRLALG